ncbi:MAG: dTDP-4-dehydrorhamnose 3,5-epimerase [Thaumarchaeota archaeon]|nr:dTDP-4-dehydrorhamnose 3,5-epimerase [Nitrososphaerota archaeon]
MTSFESRRLKIPDIILIKRNGHRDKRGYTTRIYDRSEYKSAGIGEEFVEDLLSYSVRNVLRGLHYQEPPKAQSKLVAVLQGKIFDVAVDIRKRSKNYGQWAGVTLSSENQTLIYIPKGFAHGYCVLSRGATIMYKLSEEYDPSLDRGIAWNDPRIGIKWPVDSPIISQKDASWPPLRDSGVRDR